MPPSEPPSGMRGLIRLALPLVLSNSFWTVQITLDRVFLNHLGSEVAGAQMAAAILLWVPLLFFHSTCAYASTFVAQYIGAGRPHRVGPAVGQALYFAVLGGLLFPTVVAGSTEWLIGLCGHTPELQLLEAAYFRPLCWACPGLLVLAAVNQFFIGRGDSWTVLWIDGFGTAVNAVLAYGWIFGHFGLPAAGISGAGYATAVATTSAAVLALVLVCRTKYRDEFGTRHLLRFEPALFGRLMKFGLPAGLHWAFEALAFGLFLVFVGRLGPAELAASTVAFSVNNVAFIPMLGLGQAVCVIVGQQLGRDRPDLAARCTYHGLLLAALYNLPLIVVFGWFPEVCLWLFPPEGDAAQSAAVAAAVPVLLRFVATYVVFDSINIILSFTLRGAGDTRFVTATALTLSWPVMVLPAYLGWRLDWPLTWLWVGASTYVVLEALIFWLRFRYGPWRSMRVIEPVVVT